MSVLSLLGTASGIKTYLYAGVAAAFLAVAGFAAVERAEAGSARATAAEATARLHNEQATVTAVQGQLAALQKAGDAAAATTAADAATIAGLTGKLQGTYHAEDYTGCLSLLDGAFPGSAGVRVRGAAGR